MVNVSLMYIFNKDRRFGRFGKNCDLNPQYLCIALFEFKALLTSQQADIYFLDLLQKLKFLRNKKKPTSVSTENAKLQLFVKMPYVNQHIHNLIKFSILYNEPFYTETLDIIIIQKIF